MYFIFMLGYPETNEVVFKKRLNERGQTIKRKLIKFAPNMSFDK